MHAIRSNSRRVFECLALVTIFALISVRFSSLLSAQALASDPGVDNGAHWSGTYDGVHDNISLSSGNLSFCIPLVSLKGPNKHDVTIPLCYNSQFEEAYSGNEGETFIGVGDVLSYFPWTWATNSPFGYTTPPMGAGWSLTGAPAYYGAPATSANGGLTLFMPDGARYSFASGSYGSDGQSADIYLGGFNGNDQTFYLKDGTRWSIESIGSSSCPSQGCAMETFPDTGAAGISWTNSSVTDLVGRTVTEDSGAYFTGSGTTSSSVLVNFRYPDSSDTTRTVTIQMTTMQFGCSQDTGAGHYYTNSGTWEAAPFSMPTAILLPDGLTYTFQYDSCGMLRKVTYPTGGYTRYDYSQQPQSFCPQHTTEGCYTAYYIWQVAAKHVCPASAMTLGATSASSYTAGNQCPVAEETTTYSPTPYVAINGNGNSQNIVVDPVGNYTAYQFSAPNNTFWYPALETSRQIYDASGKLWKTITTQYTTTATPGSTLHGGTYPALPTIQTTTLDNGTVSQVQWSYDLYGLDQNDSVLTEERVYDYGQGTPGPLLKKTDYTWLHRDDPLDYGWPCGVACPGSNPMHILDRKTSERVYDGAGKMLANTKYVYDNSDPAAFGVTGPPGLVTSESNWRNTDGASLTTNYVYGSYGNVTQKTDPNGNVTNYSYTDNYADGVNRNSYAFLTKTTDPLGHVTQSQYYWGTGLVAATCGDNFSGSCVTGLTSGADYTSYTYDMIGRNISTTTGDGGQTTNCFSELGNAPGQNCSVELAYPLQVTTVNPIGVTTVVTLDGEGKTTRSALLFDPSCFGGTVNVDTTYDADERKSTVSNPYCSTNTGSPTSGTTAYTYDGLSRVIQVTHPDGSYATNTYTGRAVLSADEGNGTGSIQRISQTDALGRLISVCEVTGQTQQGNSNQYPSSCGLDISGTGFLTTYGYDASNSNGPLGSLTSVTQGGVNRSFFYDSLGELQSASNPESGTTTYTYDNDGNLISKTSPLENSTSGGTVTTTYSYDKLNRLTSKTYSDGTTPSACFEYDQNASGNGVGRLTTEWTQMGACPSSPGSGVLTQRAFAAYDPVGRVRTDEQCATLGNCSGSDYTLNYGYDLAGDLASFNNGLTGSSYLSFTSQYNSAGRLAQVNGPVSAGVSQTTPLFEATGYTPSGALSNAQIGIGATEDGIAFHRDYNNSLLPIDETDTVGQTPGTATVQIAGSEQTEALTSNYPMVALTVTGTEQVNSSGTYDSGYLQVMVSECASAVNYGQSSTAASLAASLATAINKCGFSATVSDTNSNVILVTSNALASAGGDYGVGVGGMSLAGFSPASFTVTPSSTTMTTNATASLTFSWQTNAPTENFTITGAEESKSGGVWDAGTVSGSITSSSGSVLCQFSASYQEGSSVATIVTGMVSSINSGECSQFVAASGGEYGQNTGNLTLASNTVGTASDYQVQIAVTSDTGFSPPSYAVSPSTATMGADGVYFTSGELLAVIQGSNGPCFPSVSLASNSTPSSLASSLASSVNSSCTSLVSAVASGPTVMLMSLTQATSENYSLNPQWEGMFPYNSFAVSTSGPTMIGGPTTYTVADTGSLTLTVNGTQVATAYYGANSTPSTIASALASSGSGNSMVTLSASGVNLSMTAKGDGTITDYSYQVSVSSSFTTPSFSGSPESGSLSGAVNAPLYNWAISNYAPNGDVLAMTDSVMGSWTYTYDDFNRLTSGNASAGVDEGLDLSWTYDRYGNRWAQNASGTGSGGSAQPQLTFYGSNGVNTNQADGWSYDDAGNLINDGRNSYAYDAEGRIVSLNGQPTYLYDAEGRRVAKYSGGSISSVYILGLGGDQVTELTGSGGWKHSNVFAGGRLLATYEGPNGTASVGYHFHLTDWLGTERMQTNASGNNEETCTSYPFGDGLNCTGTSADATEQHFTGKERDIESGLDYFFARYLNSNLARFMTPDWASTPTAVPYATFGDPQTLNLYAYVNNNPNTGIDLGGHDNHSDPHIEGLDSGFWGFLGGASGGQHVSAEFAEGEARLEAMMTGPPKPKKPKAKNPGAQQQGGSSLATSLAANVSGGSVLSWASRIKSWFGHGQAAKKAVDDGSELAGWINVQKHADAAYARDSGSSVDAHPELQEVDSTRSNLAYQHIKYLMFSEGITTLGETPNPIAAFSNRLNSGMMSSLQHDIDAAQKAANDAWDDYVAGLNGRY